jgi:hypothetical protein
MAIKLFCEVCGSQMGNINIKDLKKFNKENGEKCKDCVKMETDLKAFVENKRAYFNKRFGQLVDECKTYMMGEIQGLLEKRAKMVEMKLYQEDEEKRKSIIGEYLDSQKPKEVEVTDGE